MKQICLFIILVIYLQCNNVKCDQQKEMKNEEVKIGKEEKEINSLVKKDSCKQLNKYFFLIKLIN